MKWQGLSPSVSMTWPWPRGKYQTSPGLEVVGLGAALRVDHGRAHAAFDDEGPLGGGRVPVQFAHHAGLHAHRHAGDALRDRQLRRPSPPCRSCRRSPCPSDFSSSNLKVGSSLPDVTGSGTLFWKLSSPPSELMGIVNENTKASCSGLIPRDQYTRDPILRRVTPDRASHVRVACSDPHRAFTLGNRYRARGA